MEQLRTETGAGGAREQRQLHLLRRPRNRVRVRIPDQYIATAFAQLVGFDQVRHSAFAIASTRGSGFGGVLPFGMPAGAGSSDGYACVKSGAGGQSEAPCDGPDSGNFGLIDFGFFGSVEIGTTIDCGSGSARRIRFPNNIAVGSDHEVTIKTLSDTALVDAPDACESGTPGPNSALTETGNNSGILGDGLIGNGTFSDGGPSRLRRSDCGCSEGRARPRRVAGATIDSNPLWAFIPPNLLAAVRHPGVLPTRPVHGHHQRDHLRQGELAEPVEPPGVGGQPPQVARSPGPGREAHAALLRPLPRRVVDRCRVVRPGRAPERHPAPCTTPVFSLNSSTTESPDLQDIQYTPRFAYIPELAGSFPSGTEPGRLLRTVPGDLRPAADRAEPREPRALRPRLRAAIRGKLAINEVTVFVFPTTMLPNGLSGADAPFAVGKNRFVQLVR